MRETSDRRIAWVFAAFLLLAGLLHIQMNFTLNPLLDTFYNCCQFFIYVGLLFIWIQSVRRRLLPTRSRLYILSAAWCMVLFLVLRIVKYRLMIEPVLIRAAWYAFYVPMILVPTFFLTSCICFHRRRESGGREALLLLPAATLAVMVLFNDAHRLCFIPDGRTEPFIGDMGTYTYGPVFYLVIGWMAVTVTAAVLHLLAASRRINNWKKALLPFLFGLLLPVLTTLRDLIAKRGLPIPYQFPEICIFCGVGVFEACIRNRLMPHNDNYPGFFSSMAIPVQICDADLHPVYETAKQVEADRETKLRSLKAAVPLNPDTRLLGKTIRGGYAFFIQDESALTRLNGELEEANAILAEENDVIEAEKDVKEEAARIEARNRVYAQAAQQIYPTQEKISALLAQLTPDRSNLRPILAKISVLNAYAKRRANFVLAESDTVSAQDLYLALAETARYLPYCGTEAYVDFSAVRPRAYGEAMALYDTFEAAVEALVPLSPAYLLIALSDSGLRLMAEGTGIVSLPSAPLPVQMDWEEGQLTLRIGFREGGAA